MSRRRLQLFWVGLANLACDRTFARSSPGCGQRSPWPVGIVSQGTVEVPGGAGPSGKALTRSYLIHLPPTYQPDRRHPLFLFFHGWGGRVDDYSELGYPATKEGWVYIRPLGMDDVPHPHNLWYDWTGFSYRSWNGSGSVASPGTAGPTCTKSADPTPCYETCGPCTDHCWWTTCADDVAFVGLLLDQIESLLCIDTDLLVAGGISNGAIFLYELAAHKAISQRLSAIVPFAGLPHVGFNRPPASPLRLFGVWGRQDTVVPGFPSRSAGGVKVQDGATLSKDGFYYTSMDQVVDQWLNVAGQLGPLNRTFHTPYDGEEGLVCMASDALSYTEAPAVPAVVVCTFDADHSWPGVIPTLITRVWPYAPNLICRLIVRVFLRQLRSDVLPGQLLSPELDTELDGERTTFRRALASIAALLATPGLLCTGYAFYQKRRRRACCFDPDAPYERACGLQGGRHI